MKNALSLVLLLAVAASAAPAPRPSKPRVLTVTTVSTTPDTAVVSPDGESSAVWGDNAITVWSIPDGKPKFQIERPEVKGSAARDNFQFKPKAFSPDGKYLMAELDHYRIDSAGKLESMAVSAVLVSVLEEKIIKTVYTIEGPCADRGESNTKLCPEIVFAKFAADARHVVIWTNRCLSDDAKVPYRYETAVSAFALDGTRLVYETQVILVSDPSGPRTGTLEKSSRRLNEFAGFDVDGRMIGLVSDDGSCVVKDFASGKRLAFLDDCTNQDRPAMDDKSGVLFSEASSAPFFKVWGFDGKLRAKIPNSDHDGYVSTGYNLTRDARYALHYRFKTWESVTGDVALWDLKTGLKVSSGTAPEFRSAYSMHLSPDRAHATVPHDSKLHYLRFDAGTALTPEERVFVASVDASDLATASAPAAVAAAAAPVANFDLPPAVRTTVDQDAYAVVIGIEKYRQAGIPSVDYAARDAKTMYDYLTVAMGFDPKNVLLMTNEQATKTDLEKNLGSWLKNRVGVESRVFVYYAGHGAPNPATGEGYLMPYEADASYLEDTAYPVAKLYSSLAKLPTKSVTVVLDACFSGQGGRSLIAKGARPLVAVVQAKAAANAVVLAAAASNQISASDPERRHGLLSSRLFQALHGAGDADGDGRVTTAEVFEFVRPAVERAARLQNLEQTPMLSPSLAEVKAAPGRPWLVLEKKTSTK